jgi:DNA-binding transcriptional MerR regulator
MRRRKMETGTVSFLNLTGIEAGLILLTGSVLLSLIIMVTYFRRVMAFLRGPRPVYKNSDQIRKWVEESEIVYEKLSKTLEERKEITNRLIEQLDAKIEALRSVMAGMDREMIPIAEEITGKEREVEITEMTEGGRDFSEIARQTGFSIGEVQLIMNLKRCQESSPLKI